MSRKDSRWLAHNVRAEGVSLLTDYPSSFTGIARERGSDGLIQEGRRRNGNRTDDQVVRRGLGCRAPRKIRGARAGQDAPPFLKRLSA
jgi:hypothetical protein